MSEHVGYVVKINELHPHSNADRLQIATIFGTSVIVGLDVKIDDIGVYFPTDIQLSEEYCENNNLVRKKDENGNNVGGYLDPDKRNIRAMKLRGEKSDGLFMPLESLAYTGVTKFEVGEKIETLNGHEICCKYIPRSNVRVGKVSDGNRTRKHSEPIAPLFAEHVDTEQLAYNLGAFKPNDQIEITLKMHGCFTGDTRVRMGDGKQKRIRNIEPGDTVLAYRFSENKFVPSKVVNVFHNDRSNNWQKIKISRENISGDKRGFIMCTPNHPFWNDDIKCWVEAKDLVVGSTIKCLHQSPILTDTQKEIAIGNLLGDGSYDIRKNSTSFICTSAKFDKEEYIDYIIKLSGGFYHKSSKTYTSGYGTQIIRAKTTRSADLYNYFVDVVSIEKNGKRVLHDGIVEKITPLSLAIFYMDDGSLAHSDRQEDRASFAVCDYDKNSVEIIKKCFEKFGIQAISYLDSNNYYRIRLNKDSADKFFSLVEKYIPTVMRYKLPEKYRNVGWKMPEVSKKFEMSYVLQDQTVLSNEPVFVKGGYKEFDLETEEHNYIVGISIVHNTSQRTALLPIFKGYKRTFLDKILRKQGAPVYDWGYVTGTRRVVLSDFEDGGYYGNNEFRAIHAKVFEGKLNKGETVYYEVVGFTTNGTPIMSSVSNSKISDKAFTKQYGDTTVFSYGCSGNGSDFYVYRMTMTNEDGFVVEYSPDFMRYRCEQMGVKCVPMLEKAYIPSQDILDTFNMTAGDWIKEKAEEYYDGPDPIGKTHIREGVVVRIVNRPKFCAYKHKNFNFKVIEGLAKDIATEPDMEEAQEVENI